MHYRHPPLTAERIRVPAPQFVRRITALNKSYQDGDVPGNDKSETMHGNNNGYATPETSGALIEMSISYVDQLTQLGVAANNIPPFRIKALSLPQGGLFDYQTEWNTPHKLHRNGTDAEVGLANLPTRKLKQAAEAAFRQAGFRAPIQHERPGDADSNHWHLKARGGA